MNIIELTSNEMNFVFGGGDGTGSDPGIIECGFSGMVFSVYISLATAFTFNILSKYKYSSMVSISTSIFVGAIVGVAELLLLINNPTAEPADSRSSKKKPKKSRKKKRH